MESLHIGTCSWKYDSWRGLVYSDAAKANYLSEYALKYDCVEVDQWFWSLYGSEKVVLPQRRVVAEYAASVPERFRFAIKLPNAITLTHVRPATKGGTLAPNPQFLSVPLLESFLEKIEPLRSRLGPLMFQFEYLNRQKMPSEADFLQALGGFVPHLPPEYTWCVESRNPNYLNERYFAFLRDHGLSHVFLHGYYMPSIFEVYGKHADLLGDTVVIRLHGPDREGMEERTAGDWSKIIEPRDADLEALAAMVKDLRVRRRTIWLLVNNHFEGCAPLTIQRVIARLGI